MPRRRGQLRVCDTQILLLLPLLPRPHRHAPILQTNPLHSSESSAYESGLAPRAVMALRRKRTHPETTMEFYEGETWRFLDVADQTKNVEELFTRRESAQRLKRAICRLKPLQRKAVKIHYLNDGSLKETADLAGISMGATKSRLSRARIPLRKAWQRESESVSPPPQKTSLSLSMTRR